MNGPFRIIERIDDEPEPLRTDLHRLVELAATDYLTLFPADTGTDLAPADN